MIVMMDAKKAADVDRIASIIDQDTCRATHTETGRQAHPSTPLQDVAQSVLLG
jgi:hypothetical protein